MAGNEDCNHVALASTPLNKELRRGAAITENFL